MVQIKSVNNAQRGFAFDDSGIIDNSLFLRFYTEEAIGEGCQAVILTNTNPKYIVKSIGEEFKEEAESAAAANYSYRYIVNLETSDFSISSFLNQYFVFRVAIVKQDKFTKLKAGSEVETEPLTSNDTNKIDAWFNSDENNNFKSDWSDPIYKNAVFNPDFTILTDSFDPYQEQQVIEAQMTFGVGETDRLKHCTVFINEELQLQEADLSNNFIRYPIELYLENNLIPLEAIYPGGAVGDGYPFYGTSDGQGNYGMPIYYYSINNGKKIELTNENLFGLNVIKDQLAWSGPDAWIVDLELKEGYNTLTFSQAGEYKFWIEDSVGGIHNRTLKTVQVSMPNLIPVTIIYETEKGFIKKISKSIPNFYYFNIEDLIQLTAVDSEIKTTLTCEVLLENDSYTNYQVKILRYYDDNSYEFIKTINLDNNINSNFEFVIEDNTPQAGKFYIYKAILLCEDTNKKKYISQIALPEKIFLFEDIYLIDEDDTFIVKYNPEVSGLKYNIGESITNTLGSQYPVYRRNEQNYRTFTIGGLISYHGDEERFTDGDVVTDSLLRNTTPNPDYRPRERNYTNNKYDALDNYHKEALRERDYRNKIINFLHKNNLKLFKSLQEGNMIVKLSNISLTSNPQLGRNIYSFSATATEMDEATIANLSKHRIHLVPMWIDGDRVYKEYYLQGTLDADGNLIVDSEELIIQEQQTILEGASNV